MEKSYPTGTLSTFEQLYWSLEKEFLHKKDGKCILSSLDIKVALPTKIRGKMEVKHGGIWQDS